ncbi:MAG: CBS domain-containing protein [Myxococcales bacterium]|nr:CBS domain-containing protein [Myxococcales bacterium]
MQAREVMTRQPHCCSIDHALNDAARIMWENDTGFLPVVDDCGSVVGVITDRDICMAAYTQGVSLASGTVASAMSRDVVSVSPGDSVRTVEALMRQNQIRRVPVLDQSGQPLGVVTLGDLARHAEQNSLRKALEGLPLVTTLAQICEARSSVAAE